MGFTDIMNDIDPDGSAYGEHRKSQETQDIFTYGKAAQSNSKIDNKAQLPKHSAPPSSRPSNLGIPALDHPAAMTLPQSVRQTASVSPIYSGLRSLRFMRPSDQYIIRNKEVEETDFELDEEMMRDDIPMDESSWNRLRDFQNGLYDDQEELAHPQQNQEGDRARQMLQNEVDRMRKELNKANEKLDSANAKVIKLTSQNSQSAVPTASSSNSTAWATFELAALNKKIKELELARKGDMMAAKRREAKANRETEQLKEEIKMLKGEDLNLLGDSDTGHDLAAHLDKAVFIHK